MANDFVLVPCILSRGGFSHERYFAIEVPTEEVTGIAHIHYCRMKDGETLPTEEDWSLDRREPGYVMVRVIRPKNGSGNTWVQTPDGEVATVPSTLLLPAKTEGTARVPVQS